MLNRELLAALALVIAITVTYGVAIGTTGVPGSADLPGHTLGVGGVRGRDDLDGDVAVELGIGRPVHLAHVAGADFLSDAIVREGFANHVWRIVLLG